MKWLRALLVGGLALSTVLAIAIVAVPSARAYGQESWQIGFSGTGVAPTTGFGFGFWGWCAFGGGTFSSGTTADCQFAQYSHSSTGRVTCEVSLSATEWEVQLVPITPGVFAPFFFVSGTAQAHPTPTTVPCLAMFGGSTSFSELNLLIPATPGHFNLGTFGGLKGAFQIQVTQLTS